MRDFHIARVAAGADSRKGARVRNPLRARPSSRRAPLPMRPRATGGPRVLPAGRPATLATLCSLALSLVLALAACAPTSSASISPTAPSTPSATRTPTVVFRADWSKGLSGWKATPGWSIQDGALQSDAGTDRRLTIPYQPAASDYDIEYTMQIVQPYDKGMFDVAATASPRGDGYDVLLYNLLSPAKRTNFYLHPQFGITIDPVKDEDEGGWGDFEPQDKPHTYRIEVRGAWAGVALDGRRTATWYTESTVTPTLSSGPVTISCSLAEVRLTSLTIATL